MSEGAGDFGADVFSYLGGSFTQGTGNIRTYTGVTGKGWAVRVNKRTGAMRILWQFEDTATKIWERRPSTNFARDFIKMLKRVRGEK